MIPLAVLGFVALTTVSILWRGYVLSVLWAWFVVTAFSLPPLSISQAIGLSLVVALLHRHGGKDDRGWRELWLLVFVGPLFSLAMGAIVRGFLP